MGAGGESSASDDDDDGGGHPHYTLRIESMVRDRPDLAAPAVLFLLVALVGKTLVKESEGLAKPLLQPPSGPPQDFATGRALAMEQMREVAARPHARSPRPPARRPSFYVSSAVRALSRRPR